MNKMHKTVLLSIFVEQKSELRKNLSTKKKITSNKKKNKIFKNHLKCFKSENNYCSMHFRFIGIHCASNSIEIFQFLKKKKFFTTKFSMINIHSVVCFDGFIWQKKK